MAMPTTPNQDTAIKTPGKTDAPAAGKTADAGKTSGTPLKDAGREDEGRDESGRDESKVPRDDSKDSMKPAMNDPKSQPDQAKKV